LSHERRDLRLWPRRRGPEPRDDLRELVAIYDCVPPDKRCARLAAAAMVSQWFAGLIARVLTPTMAGSWRCRDKQRPHR